MPEHTSVLTPDEFARVLDTYGLVDAQELARMIGRSHRTVMVLAAQAAWRTGHLPAPVYVGRSVRTLDGKGRRWRRSTVRSWLAAATAEHQGEVS